MYVLFDGLVLPYLSFSHRPWRRQVRRLRRGASGRSYPKVAFVGMRDEKTQDGGHYGIDFCVHGLRVVSYMIGSHRYYSQCWSALLACHVVALS
jgi:hypothetical protein